MPPHTEAKTGKHGDQALIARARAGDRMAFGELLSRHQDGVYALAFRFTGEPEEARDLAQEAFIRIFQGLSGFRGEAAFTTWAYVIVRNLATARAVQRGREPPRLADLEDGTLEARIPGGTDPAIALQEKETHEALQAAIMALPVKHRVVIELHHFQGLGYAEIATVLGLPIGTVKTHLFRAKAKLKDMLERRDR